METREALGLFGRYLILVLLGVFIHLFYFIFTPLTVYPVFWILSLVYENASLLEGNMIFFRGLSTLIEIIPACIAGAAYYLLTILNLTTPMGLKKRVRSLFFLLLTFLVLNVVRILVFAVLATSGSQYFEVAHNAVWYFGSTVLVVFVWFANVWLFKIKSIPVYTDMKNLFEDISSGKRKKSKKRK